MEAISCSKKLSTLLREITSKHHGNLNCSNCLHFLEEKTNLSLIKTYVKIKFLRSCSAIRKGFNQCMKSDKMPYIIYEDIKSLIKK